jgi:tRNA(Arg) A34 adenosine deaminase TadA
MDDRGWMEQAIELSREALGDDQGGPFGAVVVKDGRRVGAGRNRVLALRDPTAHAEVLAVRDACRTLGTHDLSGATVYASCEPCPMCAAALHWARVARVVYAADRDAAARAGFDDALLHREMARPPAERSLRTERLADPAAGEVLAAWARRAGRVLY